MPYVIEYPGKLYLRKAKGYSSTKRTLVSDIAQASTWARKCDAKNAARCAFETKEPELAPEDGVMIRAVYLQPSAYAEGWKP